MEHNTALAMAAFALLKRLTCTGKRIDGTNRTICASWSMSKNG